MNIYGVEISQDQLDRCVARMRQVNGFSVGQLTVTALDAGVPAIAPQTKAWEHRDVASRLADRLIQGHRKAGKIEQYAHARWRWVSAEGNL